MQNLTPTLLLETINPAIAILSQYCERSLYIPEMVNFDQAYYMKTGPLDAPVESRNDEEIHHRLIELGFEYLHETYYQKVIEIDNAPIAINIEYDLEYSIHVYPCIIFKDGLLGYEYLPIAMFTQQFIADGCSPSRKSFDPVKELTDSVALDFLPESMLQALFKGFREVAKTHGTYEDGQKIVQHEHPIANTEIHNISDLALLENQARRSTT